jgi:hypothetical protein
LFWRSWRTSWWKSFVMYMKNPLRKIPRRVFKRCGTLYSIWSLLVDAVRKLDEIDRADNPNKRLSGKVEQELNERTRRKSRIVSFRDAPPERYDTRPAGNRARSRVGLLQKIN